MKHWVLLAFVAVLLAVLVLQAGPVLASVEAKPTAPPTPTNPPPPTEEPPLPTPTEKPPAPPTPTPTVKPPAPPTPTPTVKPPAPPTPTRAVHADQTVTQAAPLVSTRAAATAVITTATATSVAPTPEPSPTPTPTPVLDEDWFVAAGRPTASSLTTEVLLTFFLMANLALVVVASERIRGAIAQGNRQALELGLAQLEAKREELARMVTVQPDQVIPCLGRLALEATGEQAGIDQVIKVTASPVPALIALGKNFDHYVFTTAAPRVARRIDDLLGDRPRRVPAYTIDAYTSGVTAAAELTAIWNLLTEEQHIPVEQRILPRTARWYLYVVPQPSGGKVAR